MTSRSVRDHAMNTQRYDFSKRRKPSTLTIHTRATIGNLAAPQEDEKCLVKSPSTPTVFEEVWDDHAIVVLSLNSPVSEGIPRTATTDSFSSTDESSASSMIVSNTIFSHKKESHSTDVFEHDGYTTTRTIIRPTPARSNVLALLSRPSFEELKSRTHSVPILRRLRSLNCINPTDAFEEEVDFIQQERDKEIAGLKTGLEIRVEQDCNVYMEERWREGVQAMLYNSFPRPVVGQVEAR